MLLKNTHDHTKNIKKLTGKTSSSYTSSLSSPSSSTLLIIYAFALLWNSSKLSSQEQKILKEFMVKFFVFG